jgi:lipid A 3-O-deacylase
MTEMRMLANAILCPPDNRPGAARNGVTAPLLGLVLSAFLTNAAYAQSDRGFLSLQIENDFLAQPTNTDRHYTNGLRLAWVLPQAAPPEWLAPALALPDPIAGLDDEPRHFRWSFAIGHSLFTPDDTRRTTIVPDDRPYAAWLYATAGLHAVRSEKSGPALRDSAVLVLGVVGKAAQGEQVQNRYHDLINVERSFGWHNQLANEVGVNLLYERQYRLSAGRLMDFEVDAIPGLRSSLGNVHTNIGADLIFRLGRGLEADFGPPRIRPAASGIDWFEADSQAWYVFAGAGGRAVARDITLDGNSFASSHRVDRKPLVGDLQFGFGIILGRARFGYTHVVRSTEFENQPSADQFGAVSLTVRY